MPKPQPNALKILIVDDSPLLQEALRGMLTHWGLGRVTTAGNGSLALHLLRRESFDLIVTDWQMEPVNGEELVRWVRQSPGSPCRNLPIIVLTGNADLPTVCAAWEAGADTVLAKPVTAAALARRIEAVMNRRRAVDIHDSNARSADRSHGNAGTTPTFARQLPPAMLPPIPPVARPALPAGLEPPRLPSPSAAAKPPETKQIRLILAVDRLEQAMGQQDLDGARLRHAVSNLQRASAGSRTVQAIANSLFTCITWVDADSEGYHDALQAHLAALRWAASHDADAKLLTAAPALLRSLRATVRALALNGRPASAVWPDVRPGPSDMADWPPAR